MGGTTRGRRFKRNVIEKKYFDIIDDETGKIDISNPKVYEQLANLASYWVHKMNLEEENINDCVIYMAERDFYYNKDKLKDGNAFSFYNLICRNYCISLLKNKNERFIEDLDIKDKLANETVECIDESFFNDMIEHFVFFRQKYIDDFMKMYKFDTNNEFLTNVYNEILNMFRDRVEVINHKQFLYLLYDKFEIKNKEIIKRLLYFMKKKYKECFKKERSIF